MDAAIKRQLQRIANNKDGQFLDHHEVTVIAHGLLNLCLENTICTSYQEDLELYLRMLTKHRTPHHARCVLAQQCLYYLAMDEDLKKLNPVSSKQNPMTPDNF
jgi:hypothetical protein